MCGISTRTNAENKEKEREACAPRVSAAAFLFPLAASAFAWVFDLELRPIRASFAAQFSFSFLSLSLHADLRRHLHFHIDRRSVLSDVCAPVLVLACLDSLTRNSNQLGSNSSLRGRGCGRECAGRQWRDGLARRDKDDPPAGGTGEYAASVLWRWPARSARLLPVQVPSAGVEACSMPGGQTDANGALHTRRARDG
ncbi:hypothetical protein MSAN_00644600 [Mycena sanguinolenta]|uniref:Uncharacterized protein n=1 Tax=Mycena sanguinolenta TaxID=230812 RepID=A0A8H6YZY9_9AGAR|nr:hypothetical protein MSAN_00644600 [Mycena sanguinolenta]